MTDTTGIIISALFGMLPVIVGLAIRVRGPRRLIRGVDWQRVSDPDGLAHYVSLLLIAIGALIGLRGGVDFALRAMPALHEATDVVFAGAIIVLVVAIALVKRRFQDMARHDEQR